MTKVVFIEPSGNEIEIDAQDGWSIMQIGTANNVDGLVGECGGSCACATCHCYVESKEELLPKADENELSMLDYAAAETQANSRLSCQIKVAPELEGIRIRLPAEQ
jgi:2Fe-2S ferredoxin